jgi:hypothetical protein
MKFQLAWLIIAALVSQIACDGDNSSPVIPSNPVSDDQHLGQIVEMACGEEVLNSTNHFVAHSDNKTLFIECVSVGWGLLKSCDSGSLFDLGSGLCIDAATPGNIDGDQGSTTIASDATSSTELPTTVPSVVRRFVTGFNFFAVPVPFVPVQVTSWKVRGRLVASNNCTGYDLCVNGVINQTKV